MPKKRSARVRKLGRKETRELDVKISFMEGLTRRDPSYVEALQLLGDHYTQRGRFDSSLIVDKHLARLEPTNPLVFYNLACSQALNGECEVAAAALEHAIALGYRDFKWLAKDPDLRQLREHAAFRRIEEMIQRMSVRIA